MGIRIGRKLKKVIMAAVCVVALGGFYLLGLNVGNGNINFGANSQNAGLPGTLNYSSVNQEYKALIENYDGKLSETQLLNGIKHGLANAPGDPYTEYFTAKEAKQFNQELNNSFSGIGAELSANSKNEIIVMSPLKGSPAEAAGLQPNDVIADINGKSTANMSIDQAVSAIRGKAGTDVTLTLLRGGQLKNVTIKRANITVPSVSYKILSGNIGYISIISFADHAEPRR